MFKNVHLPNVVTDWEEKFSPADSSTWRETKKQNRSTGREPDEFDKSAGRETMDQSLLSLLEEN